MSSNAHLNADDSTAFVENRVRAGVFDAVGILSVTALILAAQNCEGDVGGVLGWGEHVMPLVEPGTRFVAVAGGTSGGVAHNLALRSDGTVVAWGANSSGQSTVPNGLSNVSAIAAGSGQNLVLKSNGTVVKWPHSNVPVGNGV
jgi:hypothetical protein